MKTIMVSWLGGTDHDAADGIKKAHPGPIARAVSERGDLDVVPDGGFEEDIDRLLGAARHFTAHDAADRLDAFVVRNHADRIRKAHHGGGPIACRDAHSNAAQSDSPRVFAGVPARQFYKGQG